MVSNRKINAVESHRNINTEDIRSDESNGRPNQA
jgi:hypothetical protein